MCLHEQAAGRRHGALLSPARTLEGVAEGALPQHGSDQDLKRSQTQDRLQRCAMKRSPSLSRACNSAQGI